MAYNPIGWVDGETPVNAENLGKMDDGIEAANDAIDEINTARENGEFKGDKGDPGVAGADGVSATHSWNGTVLTITSASGSSSADLKGEKGDTGEKGDKGDKGDTGATGEAGYSPVRGTDYWTDADKAEIKAYVDEAILGGAW